MGLDPMSGIEVVDIDPVSWIEVVDVDPGVGIAAAGRVWFMVKSHLVSCFASNTGWSRGVCGIGARPLR